MKTMKKLQEKTISKKGREESGITLIALIITIIILLILATVSIAVLTGDNGIIAQANQARIDTKVGEEKEQIALAYNAAVTDKYADGDYKSSVGITAEELRTQLDNQKAGATATSEVEGTPIKITFTASKNVYTLDGKTGVIEGPTEDTTVEP